MMRIICLFLFVLPAGGVQAQVQPSREAFVNEVFAKYGDTTHSSYYLVMGADSCRFEKFDYDEWVKYYLVEKVPLTILNELAYKVHLAREPYYWQKDKLKKAVCITAARADSLLSPTPDDARTVFSFSEPQFTDDGQYAVMDINFKFCINCGGGYTFIYRHDREGGWLRIGIKENWLTRTTTN
jgi:hypothetical protein